MNMQDIVDRLNAECALLSDRAYLMRDITEIDDPDRGVSADRRRRQFRRSDGGVARPGADCAADLGSGRHANRVRGRGSATARLRYGPLAGPIPVHRPSAPSTMRIDPWQN